MKFNNIYDIEPLDILLGERYITRREAEQYIKNHQVNVFTPEDYIEMLAEFLAALNKGTLNRKIDGTLLNGLYGEYGEEQYPYVVEIWI